MPEQISIHISLMGKENWMILLIFVAFFENLNFNSEIVNTYYNGRTHCLKVQKYAQKGWMAVPC